MPTPEELWERYKVRGRVLSVRATANPAKPATIIVRVAHRDYDTQKPASYVDLHLFVEVEDVPYIKGLRGLHVEFIVRALALAGRPVNDGPLALETWPAAESQLVPHAKRMLRGDLWAIGRQTCEDPHRYRIHLGSGVHAFVELVSGDGGVGKRVNAARIEEGSLWEFNLSAPNHAIFLETLRRGSATPAP